MLVRGKGRILEVVLTGSYADAARDVRVHLAERPEFYRGSRATADLSTLAASEAEIRDLVALFGEFGVALDGVYGPQSVAEAVLSAEVAYLGLPPLTEVTTKARRARAAVLSDGARSLDADFAGARADLAARRTTSVATAAVTIPASPSAAPSGISTLYHRGTLRGGQSLHNLGNIVVIGDVNPGAELVASGDIVVFGAMRGVAHAGAQGERSAQVIALDLTPTQLRIATLIAADSGDRLRRPAAEHARIEGERIAIYPLADAIGIPREVVR